MDFKRPVFLVVLGLWSMLLSGCEDSTETQPRLEEESNPRVEGPRVMHSPAPMQLGDPPVFPAR